MCDKNINEILDVRFDSVNDEFNWLNNTNNAIITESNKLKLFPESNTSRFTRSLGTLDPSNNRIGLQVNLSVLRPSSSTQSGFCAKLEVFNGANLIDGYSVYIENIEVGEILEYNFDRVYKYEGLSGAISLKITTVDGWENQLFLDYIKCRDYNYCDDDVRNYFVLDSILSDSLGSVSSAIQLLEYKIDNVETLTPAFFSENNTPISNPISDWLFAKSNLDGSNRVSETNEPNTFNPFVSAFGLEYDATNYFDGKPTGTITGSDYGSGIMNFGFDKPSILNGNLNNKNGAFFIDIDYTKSLKIVFDVVVNNSNSNVFNSPNIYRKYTIIWSPEKCTGSFSYENLLTNEVVTQNINGFLFGITGYETTSELIGCNEQFSFSGSSGVFEFQMDLGTGTGMAGINYNGANIPDKFEIEWNGQTFSTGFVGSDIYNQQLLNAGISQNEINTGNPSTGFGTLIFDKNLPSPTIALIRVTGVLNNTGWTVNGICPSGGTQNQPPTVEIDTDFNTLNQGESYDFEITANDSDGTIESWSIQWGNEGVSSGQGSPPLTISKTFNLLGSKNIVINVEDNDGLVGSDTLQVSVVGTNVYQITGKDYITCGTGVMNGTLTVQSGQVTVLNRFSNVQGDPVSAILTIDGNDLDQNESIVLGVGTYPFTSTSIDCTDGTAENELIINN